jgi:hypothetical protein
MWIKYLGESKYRLAVCSRYCDVEMKMNSWFHIDCVNNKIYFEGVEQKLNDIVKE